MPPFTSAEYPGSLSPEQVVEFRERGFLIARGMLGGAEVDEIRQTFMAMAGKGPVPGLSDASRMFSADDPLACYPRMMHPHRHPDKPVGPLAMKYMLDPRIGVVLRELFNEEPLAAQSMFYFKPPGARGQDLHQDNFYLRVHPGTCVAAWIAIDDADRENGGLVAVPGSHRLDVQCPGQSDRSIFFTGDRVDPPPGMAEEAIDMHAGDVLFFGGSVIHGSYPNRSKGRFRRALICHYAPMSCIECARSYFPLYNFAGDIVAREAATGGGPCGEPVASEATPH